MGILTTAGCRIRQAVLRAGRARRPERQTVEEGTGAVFSAAQLLRQNRLKKPMIVSAPADAPVRERVVHALTEGNLPWASWEYAGDGPTEEAAEELRLAWAKEACDSFLVIGGAGALDLVKIAAALAGERGRALMSLVGVGKLRRRPAPVVAVPTAAGSGVESLAWAAFADRSGQSFVIEDRALVPPFLIQDPELLADVPRPVLAGEAADGICLAVEAYLSGFADDGARATAADALRAYLSGLEPCWNTGGTPAERSALMTASRLAGEAASQAGTGYARMLARGLCRVSDVRFSDACAVLLPLVMEKYGKDARPRLDALAGLAGIEGGAPALIGRLRQLWFRIGLPDRLSPVEDGLLKEAGELAAAAADRRCACPVVWTAAECGALLRSAMRNTTESE